MANRHSFGKGDDGATHYTSYLADHNLTFDVSCVPVMAETLLLMELQAREQFADLSNLSQLILADLGATLQVLRFAGREGVFDSIRSRRVEDCISALGVDACLDVLSRQAFKLGTRRTQVVAFWRHASNIAAFCRFLAEEMYLPVNPEDAYLVGLFHEVAALPALLGWKPGEQIARNESFAALRMAEAWSLPECIAEYFWECTQSARDNLWAAIVDQAHSLENTPSDSSPMASFYFRVHRDGPIAMA